MNYTLQVTIHEKLNLFASVLKLFKLFVERNEKNEINYLQKFSGVAGTPAAWALSTTGLSARKAIREVHSSPQSGLVAG